MEIVEKIYNEKREKKMRKIEKTKKNLL